ncbi:hypothetical protein BC833DRAFT_619220 [Globomyces pollinis-pini]|nr:hypothetical protein BC833DRAFT_619220 [Globomyces pollinis-pini]
MKEFVSFTSIGQSNNLIQSVTETVRYIGRDENNKPILDLKKPLPKLKFTGTVKLHGTNAGVLWNEIDGLWCQSRNKILTVEDDNMGFAKFVDSNKKVLETLIKMIPKKSDDTVCVYGEWCGGNIQANVALQKLPRMFVVFSIQVVKGETREWLTTDIIQLFESKENQIYNTMMFSNWQMEIDMGNFKGVQNQLIEMTEEVERECPVGKYFGVSGVGEGIVWMTYDDPFAGSCFKVKGKKHSVSKVKVLAPIDHEKLESIKAFVDYAVTENRLNQGIEYVFRMNNEEPTIQKVGAFLKWVLGDIIKEEIESMKASGFTPKDVNSSLVAAIKEWFIQKYT